MNNHLYALLWAMLLSLSSGYAQYSATSDFNDVLNNAIPSGSTSRYSIKGNPYLYTAWFPGEVFLNDNKRLTNINLKYDIHGDALMCLKPGSNDSIVLDKSRVSGFILQSSTFKLLPTLQNDKEELKYCEVLHEGVKSSLYMERRKQVAKAGYQGPGLPVRVSDEFTDDIEILWIRTADNKVEKFGKNRKSLHRAFPKHTREIESYLSKEKIKLNKAEDLKKILSWIDTL